MKSKELAITKFNIEIDNNKIFNKNPRELLSKDIDNISILITGVKKEGNEELISDVEFIDNKLNEKAKSIFKENDEKLINSLISTMPKKYEYAVIENIVIESDKNKSIEIPKLVYNDFSEDIKNEIELRNKINKFVDSVGLIKEYYENIESNESQIISPKFAKNDE